MLDHECDENCVHPGDPRYDGFRITELWVITGIDPQDNQEGIVGGVDGQPLLASDEVRRKQLEAVLPQLEAGVGVPLKLRHFVLKEDSDG